MFSPFIFLSFVQHQALRLRVSEAVKSGSWDTIPIPARATTTVAMLEYFVRNFGFEGDYVGVNVRNVGYLLSSVKSDMVAQVRRLCIFRLFFV